MAVPMGMAVAHCSKVDSGTRGSWSESRPKAFRDSSSMSSAKSPPSAAPSGNLPSASTPTSGEMRRPAGPSGMTSEGRPSKRVVVCPAAPTSASEAWPMMDCLSAVSAYWPRTM